jgi:hypothetical protein
MKNLSKGTLAQIQAQLVALVYAKFELIANAIAPQTSKTESGEDTSFRAMITGSMNPTIEAATKRLQTDSDTRKPIIHKGNTVFMSVGSAIVRMLAAASFVEKSSMLSPALAGSKLMFVAYRHKVGDFVLTYANGEFQPAVDNEDNIVEPHKIDGINVIFVGVDADFYKPNARALAMLNVYAAQPSPSIEEAYGLVAKSAAARTTPSPKANTSLENSYVDEAKSTIVDDKLQPSGAVQTETETAKTETADAK